MIAVNNEIKIIFSDELMKMKLEELIGKTGFVVEIVFSSYRKLNGYMVFLHDEPYLDEYMWFIPEKSVRHV